MENSNYVIFDILGVKNEGGGNSFSFDKDAECVINDDRFIKKIVVSSDISKATFYLHDSIESVDNRISEIIDYLYMYLGNIMIAIIKNSIEYANGSLNPTICCSTIHLAEINEFRQNDFIQMRDSAGIHCSFSNGDEKLKKWVQDVDISSYTSKLDKYDILFLLLQGKDIVQKYMAMYAYLMSLVKGINSSPRESQKQVVEYISANYSRVGIELHTSQCTRPGARADEVEDQFTSLRNKIAHPSAINSEFRVYEKDVNQLASIVCCAIEDIPLNEE